MKERLRSVPVLGWVLRVHERFGEVNGTALANGIALQAFLSLFPLLIVAVAVIGHVSEGDATLADDLIDTLGLSASDQLATDLREAITTARDSKEAAGAVGFAGLVWTGLGVVAALQRAVDRAWQTVARGLKDKVRAVAVILGAFLVFAGSVALGVALNFLPAVLAPLSIISGLAVNVALFLWLFVALGRLPVGWRARLPGALVGALGLEALKLVGSVYIPRLVANSSALYGSIGIVVAILAWLALFGRLFVYASVINVVEWERRRGTVKVPIEVPRVETAVAVAANRSGAVVDRLED